MLFPCLTGLNYPKTMRWARKAGREGRQVTLGRLTHFNEIAGSARFTFIYPEKLMSTPQFSSGGSGHLKRGPNHAFHPCQKHLDLAKSPVLYIKLVASVKKERRNLFKRGQKRQQHCTSWSDQNTIDANKLIQDLPFFTLACLIKSFDTISIILVGKPFGFHTFSLKEKKVFTKSEISSREKASKPKRHCAEHCSWST